MKNINDLVYECLKPKLEYICDEIQNSLEDLTDETKDYHSYIIESYANIIHEMLKYIEGKECGFVETFSRPKLKLLKNYAKILY